MTKEEQESLTATVKNALAMVRVNLDELFELERLSDEDIKAIARGDRLVTADEAWEISNSIGCAAEGSHKWEYEIDEHLRWLHETGKLRGYGPVRGNRRDSRDEQRGGGLMSRGGQ